jgi:predicted Zn finger-like uncharacterized protein
MFLTCDKCQTTYKLDEKHLAQGGRVVRCTECGNTWFESQVKTPEMIAAEEAAAASKADMSFEEAMAAAQSADDENIDDGSSRAIAPMPQDFEMPVMDYRPGGMGPNAFGLCTFLLLAFVSVSALFLLRGTIIAQWPTMTALYEASGVTLRAPGEGLSLSELTAEKQKAGRAEELSVIGKISNITGTDIAYPAMEVILRGPYGAFLKEWDVAAKDSVLASGETIPLELSFTDVPEGGNTVEIRVKGGSRH